MGDLFYLYQCHQPITIYTGDWNRTWKLELEKPVRSWGWLLHGIFSDSKAHWCFFFIERLWGAVVWNVGMKIWILESDDLVLPMTWGSYLTMYKIEIIIKWDLVYRVLSPAPYTKLLFCKCSPLWVLCCLGYRDDNAEALSLRCAFGVGFPMGGTCYSQSISAQKTGIFWGIVWKWHGLGTVKHVR